MNETRDLLERVGERFEFPDHAFEGLIRRRDHRVLNRRAGAAVMAVAVSVLAAVGLIRAFGSPKTGDVHPTPTAAIADLTVVDLGSGRATPLPHPISGIFSLRHLSVSPDGASIAFVGKRRVAGPKQLFVANADGSDVRQLTAGATDAAHPSWSPDGTHIVYEGDVGGHVDLFIVDVAEGRVTRLTDDLSPTPLFVIALSPRFTPDGRSVVFTKVAPTSVELWTMSVAGGQPSRLRSNASLGMHSPDGTRMAFRYATADGSVLTLGGIFIGDPHGRDADPIEEQGTGSGGFVLWDPEKVSGSGPRWSPDGSRLLELGMYSRRGPVAMQLFDLSTNDRVALGRAIEASWLGDDTLLVRGYVPPTESGSS